MTVTVPPPGFGSVAVTLSVGEVPTFVAWFAGEFKLGGMSGVDDGPGGGTALAATDLPLLEWFAPAMAVRGATGALVLAAPREVPAAVPATAASRPLTDRFFTDRVPSSTFGPGRTTAVTVKKEARRHAKFRALAFGILMGPS